MVLPCEILLMVQKSGDHQLRLVVSPIIYRALHIPGGGCLGFLPSTVGGVAISTLFGCPGT